MKVLDPQHPFFKPLWRRIVTVVAPAAWGLFELSSGEAGWAVVFIGAAAYAGYELFLAPQPAPGEKPADDEAMRDDKGDEG